MTRTRSRRLSFSIVVVTIAVTAGGCQWWTSKLSTRHPGDEVGDACKRDTDCDTNWCVNDRCDERGG